MDVEVRTVQELISVGAFKAFLLLMRNLFFTPWSEQIRPKLDPEQLLRLNAATGRQRRSRHIMLGPQGVPSST